VRILHVSDCYLPRLGGIEVQVDELARAQLAAGHLVSIVTATPSPGRDPSMPAVHRVAVPWLRRLPWELPVGGSPATVLGRVKPDVVHIHTGAVSPFAWRAIRHVLRERLPAVVTVHSMWGPVSAALYRGFAACLGRYPSGLVITAVSEAAAGPVRAVVAGRVPVEVVSNGIETARWRPATNGAAGAEGRGTGVHIVSVGRLAPRKEPVRLLRLLAATRRQVPAALPLRATIVGDGPARSCMVWFIRRHGMAGWVRLAGRLDRHGVREVLAGADIFLAPAARESFGLAALEARLAGVPVVAQAGGGVSEFITPGREGLLGGGFDGLTGALGRLATDHALRTEIAAHNRVTEPMRCTWPAVLTAFDRCYERAAATRRPVPLPAPLPEAPARAGVVCSIWRRNSALEPVSVILSSRSSMACCASRLCSTLRSCHVSLSSSAGMRSSSRRVLD
jgi:glycosyltransferase involved in cell wall biosynthesis